MKRMSEVLCRELPTTGNELLHLITNETSSMDDSYVAHAINHVDALADALESCVKALAEMPAGEPANESDRAYHQALDALNAYRGSK